MTPERWRQITDAFHAARERDSAVRDAFLDEACAGDAALHAEVNAMLAADREAGRLGETPVLDVPEARALGPGDRLGPYEVVAFVAAGGMGEVYRARDTRLGREVALKVLRDLFAYDPEQLARFKREAQVLAALNHPHIATLYGLEEVEGLRALILELVEGPTLAERAARGALPMAEALPIARQIADALAAAHASGVIHRDLKPANIKLTSAGTVKVLDFGLAKVHPGGVGPSPIDTGIWKADGLIRGTAAYMSPEQARGGAVEKRTDIWAFGCVLYEMLTGRVAFPGETVSDTIAAILEREPDWSALPSDAPPAIRRLLESCLQKDLKLRRRDASDLSLEIEGIDRDRREARPVRTAGVRRFRSGLTLAMVASVAGGAVTTGFWLSKWEAPMTSGPLVQTTIELPANAPLALGTHLPIIGVERGVIALSPDGRKLAYVGESSSGTQVYLRDLAAHEVRPVSGTEGAFSVFFSPDSRWLGFLTDATVKKVALGGGAPVTICNARSPGAVSWLRDETIYFNEDQHSRLSRVSAAGGTPTVVTRAPGVPDIVQGVSAILPDGKQSLIRTQALGFFSGDYGDVSLLSLQTAASKVVVRSGYDARYVEPGYLLYGRSGNLLAARFDPVRGETQGDPGLVASGAAMESLWGYVHATASETGVMAYVPGGDRSVGRLAWVDRQGRTEFLPTPPRVYKSVRLSPDGRRLAASVADVINYVWVYDLARGEGRRLTADERSGFPTWHPDGVRIAYTATLSPGRRRVLIRSADGGPVRELLPSDENGHPTSFSADGRLLAVNTSRKGWGVLIVSANGGLQRLETGGNNYRAPELSPDGRFVAYVSNETGQEEIFVQSLSDDRIVRQVSVDGGAEPAWCQSGELFYRQANHWMAIKIRTTPELQWEPARLAFRTDFVDTLGRSYDISPDGKRLLVVKRAQPDIRTRINLLINWTAVLPQTQ